MGSNHRVAVLGAGIVGLSTALEFQARFPSCEITIVADKFDEETTSDGAAGVFEPSPKFMGPDVETTRKWIKDSYEHYSSLLNEPCGVKVLEGYALAKYDEKCVENHYLKPVLPVYRRMGEEELSEISPGDWKYGTFMSTLSIPCRKYLPWAMDKFKKSGGRVEVWHVKSLAQLAPEYNVVFNCTGLGAADLCSDMHVIPIRGQVIKIQDPTIDKFYMSEYGTYIVPNCYDGLVTLGGTQNFDFWNRTIDPFDSESILQRCARILPRIKSNAGRLQVWTGLRPYRFKVRVECDAADVKIKAPSILHFYSMNENGLFIAPSANGLVTLGGTRDFGQFELAVDPYATQAILAYTAAVRPEIAELPIESEWVGLWPYRGHVRVELENGSRPAGPKIIHNYGHGGYGVTSAPGTARRAVDIFENMHRSTGVTL